MRSIIDNIPHTRTDRTVVYILSAATTSPASGDITGELPAEAIQAIASQRHQLAIAVRGRLLDDGADQVDTYVVSYAYPNTTPEFLGTLDPEAKGASLMRLDEWGRPDACRVSEIMGTYNIAAMTMNVDDAVSVIDGRLFLAPHPEENPYVSAPVNMANGFHPNMRGFEIFTAKVLEATGVFAKSDARSA